MENLKSQPSRAPGTETVEQNQSRRGGSNGSSATPVQIKTQNDINKEAEIHKLILQERMKLEAEYGVEAKKLTISKDLLRKHLQKTRDPILQFSSADLHGNMKNLLEVFYKV